MEQLLEDYKRKLEAIKQMIADDNVESESTLERLKTKQGMIRSFIIDIERAMADANTGDSGLHLQRVMHRKLFLEERIAYTENKLKQDRNTEEVDSLEYDLYGFKQQLSAIEYVLYGA